MPKSFCFHILLIYSSISSASRLVSDYPPWQSWCWLQVSVFVVFKHQIDHCFQEDELQITVSPILWSKTVNPLNIGTSASENYVLMKNPWYDSCYPTISSDIWWPSYGSLSFMPKLNILPNNQSRERAREKPKLLPEDIEYGCSLRLVIRAHATSCVAH